MRTAAQQLRVTALLRSLVNLESISIKQEILMGGQYKEPKPGLNANYMVNPTGMQEPLPPCICGPWLG